MRFDPFNFIMFSLLPILSGVIFLSIALQQYSTNGSYTKSTVGKVIKTSSSRMSGTSSLRYYYIIEFIAEESDKVVFFNTESNSQYQVGNTVEVNYDENNLPSADINDFSILWPVILFGFLGSCFIIIGLIMTF